MNKSVVLGFSGGVDSTAAAIILKNKGYKVTALYFDVLDNTVSKSGKRAEEVAALLEIDYIYKDISLEFSNLILSRFKAEYLNGRTPIPCIFCNPYIKFKVLNDAAEDIGAQFIATGHYASLCSDEGTYFIKHANNYAKDQSYMLGRLPQNILKRTILPLGEYYDKQSIRNLVRDYNLPNFGDKDSQDICFIPDGDYRAYLLANGLTPREGIFTDKNGNILGKHNGSFNFTIGQRKGLGIAIGKPAFVTDIDPANNIVVIGDNEDLFTNTVYADELFFTKYGYTECVPDEYLNRKLTCKLRYTAKEAECELNNYNGRMQMSFTNPQRAATPGQAAVIYDNDKVIGCGIICK